jgi:release factor glutamine methyltransferase
MGTLREIRNQFAASLSERYDSSEISELFWQSAEHVTRQPAMHLRMGSDNGELAEGQAQKFDSILTGLQQGRPLQYILSEAWFYGLPFEVNEHVLIPRPETEELVDLILKEHRESAISLLDIGSGSGCIPIALKKNLPAGAMVFGLDVSVEALAVARRNAERLQTSVQFFHCDILNECPNILPSPEKFNVIVSNPPYITPLEKEDMHGNVLDHEPHLALFVEEDKPLIFYEAIALYAQNQLAEGGKLYFEINKLFGQETIALLQRLGFVHIQLKRDLSGNDRIVSAQLP